MPSSEEIIDAQNEIKQLAIQALVNEGHPRRSAEVIVQYMQYDQQISYAEKIKGPIYRGPYSPY
jgi:hypothetical protein